MVYSWSVNRPDNTVFIKKKSKTFSFSVSLFLCALSERVVTVFMIVCLFKPVTQPVLCLLSCFVVWLYFDKRGGGELVHMRFINICLQQDS